MKAIKILSIVIFSLSISSYAAAQNYKLEKPFLSTKTIKVNGVCEMCKHRIEHALKKSSAVFSANWDINSKTIQVQYYKNLINSDSIQQMIAAEGHDTEKFKAADNVYNMLPECCEYRKQ
jgi:periplasmic mercuric ion binding protein